MAEIWLIIAGLAAATFAIRLGGVLIGQRLPHDGVWARALKALPGSLIVALVSVSLVAGGPREWAAGVIAALTAILTRNLPLTMLAGILSVWLLRQYV